MSKTKTNQMTVSTVRGKMRDAAKKSGLTQEEIGLRMGFSKDSARKAVSRLLNTDSEYDPRLSTLLIFATAIDLDPKNLV